MSEKEFTDSAGNPLHVGSFVVYYPTGTRGTIIEMISDNEGSWALVDKTNLYYKTEVLRTISLVREKELEEKEFSVEEVSEKLEKQKEFVPTEMDHSNVESGG
jgi:hypothetical protein